jgi:hypothetical protein
LKIILGTLSDLEAITQEEFVFGAPLRCTYFSNAVYDPESDAVFGKRSGQWDSSSPTTRLQEVGYSDTLGSHYVIHIDEFPFSDKTLSEYFEEYYGDEVIMSRLADSTITVVDDEEVTNYTLKEVIGELTTPQDWVVSEIYSKYPVTEMEI